MFCLVYPTAEETLTLVNIIHYTTNS